MRKRLKAQLLAVAALMVTTMAPRFADAGESPVIYRDQVIFKVWNPTWAPRGVTCSMWLDARRHSKGPKSEMEAYVSGYASAINMTLAKRNGFEFDDRSSRLYLAMDDQCAQEMPAIGLVMAEYKLFTSWLASP
jgi:hypothetical protein